MAFRIFQKGKQIKQYRTYYDKFTNKPIYKEVDIYNFENAVEIAENRFKKTPVLTQIFDNQNNLVYQIKNKDLFDL
jgi:hypothetical protein